MFLDVPRCFQLPADAHRCPQILPDAFGYFQIRHFAEHRAYQTNAFFLAGLSLVGRKVCRLQGLPLAGFVEQSVCSQVALALLIMGFVEHGLSTIIDRYGQLKLDMAFGWGEGAHIDLTPAPFTSRSLRFHVAVTSSSLRSHFDFTPALASLRYHFGPTSTTLRVCFVLTSRSPRINLNVMSSACRCRFAFILISLRCQFAFTSMLFMSQLEFVAPSLGFRFDVTPSPLPHHTDFTSKSLRFPSFT